ncbi:auxilin-related protein 2 [Punica granatum]|uniref:Auxilin-related protein 2 n=2 Tax=Punica granatum TaxID=22663 RepID=A0A6P8EFB6_PUNGR|nr:auxilin-related protein 2 [Punica granatum]PKI68064.1 hypothetical protein CRG98_011660 [Punica granatum]
MDESWRMRMGMPASSQTPRRRTVTASPPGFTRRRSSLSEALDPDDFADVFGGPPQTVLLRKFSGDFVFAATTPTSFYEEVFRPPELASPATRSGRSLPAFRIPERTDTFYGDIFGSDGDRRSRDRTRPGSNAKSKPKSRSNSSSVLSSEDLSPLRPVIRDDVALSSFASKLRPINVPCRWNSSTIKPDEPLKTRLVSPFPSARASPIETQYSETEHGQHSRSPFNSFSRRVTSPETFSIDPSSYKSVKISSDDIEVNTPAASVVSSLGHQDLESRQNNDDNNLMVEEEGVEADGDEDEDEISSSFIIEIGPNHREPAGEAEGIDEAIAWAKERFNAHQEWKDSSLTRQGKDDKSAEEKEGPDTSKYFHESRGGHHKMHLSVIEMEQVDEDIRSWLAGKENNIRLLLSTLHQILWPRSGWSMMPITSLMESSLVKKAYQKARLCLHPDKLQQRGATAQEKYIAEKAFSILQDAWAAFTSQDILFG